MKVLLETRIQNVQEKLEYGHQKSITPEKKESWKVLQSLIDHLLKKEDENAEKIKYLKVLLGSDASQGTFSKIIYEAKSARTVNSIYTCLKKLDIVKKVLTPIEKGLKDYNSLKFRPLLLFLHLIVEDPTTSEGIIESIVDLFDRVLIANTKYFNEVNLILQWMTKVTPFINLDDEHK